MSENRKRRMAGLHVPTSRLSVITAFLLLSFLWLSAADYHLCTAFVPTSRSYQHQHAITITTSSSELNLFRTLERAQQKTNGQQQHSAANGSTKIPFVIERLGERPRDDVFKGIAEMCISVFFNNGKQGRAMPPWKEVQLSYLRMIQMADLRRRRVRDKNTNAMFVAYRVEEAAPNAAQSQPLILNLRDVNNLNALSGTTANNNDYVKGEILGFCEVSMVPFGLVAADPNKPPLPSGFLYDDSGSGDDNLNSKRMVPKRRRNADIPRPVLTNLSVKVQARSSGVGSKLLNACERAASGEWGKSEIVLEVEDDNVAVREWYQKRGYRVLFSDPTSKRYDVDGLFLRKVRCTRQILRKAMGFSMSSPVVSSSEDQSFDTFGGLNDVFRRLRDNVLQTSS